MLINKNNIRFALFLVCFCVCAVYSAEFGMGNAERILTEANKEIFNWVTNIISIGLFGIALWMFIDAYVQRNLANRWMHLIGIAVFIAVLQSLPKIFELLADGQAPF